MDAQGVSMCEAMASGLPVISFKIAAIPEFIEHLKTGILVNPFNLQESAEWIDNLVEDYNLYLRLSENARKFIETIDISKTTDKELQVAKEILK
jgi:glycosyltransferase involved in cell wall biosynthesis